MKIIKAQQKETVYFGLVLIIAGLFLKQFVEFSLVADGQIESTTYLALVSGLRVLAIASGVWLLIKQPAIKVRAPGKAEIGLFMFSILLALGSLEAGTRLWLNYIATPEQYERYVMFTSINPKDFAYTPHQYLSYYPTPNYRKGGISHNSLGFRNDEFPIEKPDGVYRIVALGGSSTYDVRIANNQETFTAQLERLLKEQYGHQNVQVINAGVPGYNSWEMLINLEFRVLDLQPDLIIIYEGTNDVHARLVDPSNYRGDNSGRRRPWNVPTVAMWEHSALLRTLSRMMNIRRQVSVDDFVSAPTFMSWPFEYRLTENKLDPHDLLKQNKPIYFRRNLEFMIALANEQDAAVLLATWAHSPELNDYASKDYYQQGFQENNEVVKEVATAHNVALFDFAQVMPQDAKYWADGRHSNEAGALEKAALFAAFIENQRMIKR